MKTVENLRLIVKAFEQLPMVEGGAAICNAIELELAKARDYNAFHVFCDTKTEAWACWPSLAVDYRDHSSFPVPLYGTKHTRRQEQFFDDRDNGRLWTGEAGKLRRSLAKHMLAYYRLELAKVLPVGFEGFKAFCMAQDSKKAIDNSSCWEKCAVGEYGEFMGLDSSEWCNMSSLARTVTTGKQALHNNLNYSKFLTYGQLKRYLQKNYK